MRPVAADAFPDLMGCACEQPDAGYKLFRSRGLGRDDTDGRFADVSLERCRRCGRLWLRYFVEYEAFSRSGRWARGLISDEAAEAMTPADATHYLHERPWYLYGGSYFEGRSGMAGGPMAWGP